MKLISARYALVLLLLLAACGDAQPIVGALPTLPESLAPLTGTEPRYLAFQIFEGAPDPVIPFDYPPLVYTPVGKIAAIAHTTSSRRSVSLAASVA